MVPDITLGRTDTTLDLSSKEPRSDRSWGELGQFEILTFFNFRGPKHEITQYIARNG